MLSDSQKERSLRGWTWMVMALLGLLTAAVFHNVRQAEFLQWDDDINIQQNPHVRGLSGGNVRWMFTDASYVRRYIPLTWLAWACHYEWFGPGPLSYHLGNVLVHGLNAVMVFLIIRRLLRRAARDEPGGAREPAILVCAALGAALWAVHPLRVEPVAWASGRIYCQALLFLLLSLLAYLRYVDAPPGTRMRKVWYVASVLGLGLSLLTYPLALGYAGVLVLLDFHPLRRLSGRWAGLREAAGRRLWLEKIPFVAIVGLALGVTLWALKRSGGLWEPPPTLAQFGVWERAMQAFYVWACFLWRPFVPFDLSPVYTRLLSFSPFEAPFVASVVAVLGISALLFWKRRQWPGLGVAWLCHLILLVPMLGLTEHPHHANDRYSLLASIPMAVAVAALLLKFWERPGARLKALAGAVAAVVAFALLSFKQTGVWRDGVTLFRHTLVQLGDHPQRADILWRYGTEVARKGRFDEAKACFTESLGIRNDLAGAHLGYADLLLREGRLGESLPHYARALQLEPRFPGAYKILGDALAAEGRAAEAAAHYRAALKLQPDLIDALNNLAFLLATTPDDTVRNGREAVALAERAASLTGHRSARIEGTLAASYAEVGRFQDAIQSGDRARTLALASGETNLARLNTELLELYRRGQPYRLPAPSAGTVRP